MAGTEGKVVEQEPPFKTEVADPELPPEEGFRGWLCAAGGFVCLFCSFGFLNA